MTRSKKISSALLSVFYKDGLEPIARELHAQGVTLYSTGGTQRFLESLDIPVVSVESVTDYPSILGGRVKTLHPKVFGGILARTALEGDQKEVAQYEIPLFDLVVVDLYPFEETVAQGASESDIIEKIDIGGISLIRAAAKNHQDVWIVSSRNQYADVLNVLQTQGGETTLEQRKAFAAEAFAVSSQYDTAIYNYFDPEQAHLRLSLSEKRSLRYGENPHQQGAFYGDLSAVVDQLHGKELSYNNLLDVDAAVGLVAEFDEPTFVIIKHNNACGLASRDTVFEAFTDALAGDPVSAFGGVFVSNVAIDLATAEKIDAIFYEILIAPAFDADALELLQRKAKRILLKLSPGVMRMPSVRSILNGVLVQDSDPKTETAADLQTVTGQSPNEAEVADLLFANKIVKHTKSNAIVLAKNRQLIGSGTGQTSRVDALNQAIHKAKHFDFDPTGAVMASDAFFPFPDCVEIAHQAGIDTVIQPGGSIRDKDSVDYCNQHGMRMVITGARHFKH